MSNGVPGTASPRIAACTCVFAPSNVMCPPIECTASSRAASSNGRIWNIPAFESFARFFKSGIRRKNSSKPPLRFACASWYAADCASDAPPAATLPSSRLNKSSITSFSPALTAYFPCSAQYVAPLLPSTLRTCTPAMATCDSRGASFSSARIRRIAFVSSISFPVRSYTKNIPFHTGVFASATAAPVERFRLVGSLQYPSVNEFSSSPANSCTCSGVNFGCVDFSSDEPSMPAAIAERTGAKSGSSHSASSAFVFRTSDGGTPRQIM